MPKTLAFRVDDDIAEFIRIDADGQHSNESAILRQIIYKHYEDRRVSRRRAEQDKSMLAPSTELLAGSQNKERAV